MNRTFGGLGNGRGRAPFEAGATLVAPRPVHANGDSAAGDAMLKVMADL